jgi:pimeloyl-ACP methyl ester carboxylesterase
VRRAATVRAGAEGLTLSSWWQSGVRLPVQTQGGEAELFVWEAGEGPTVTLLHGYPGSSYDWNVVATDLATRFRVLAPDLLGFGASDKRFPYPYSLREQADLVEQVWSARGVTESAVVAHDYSASIGQELLRRAIPVVSSVVFLNGGIYPALHRPTDGQRALLGPQGDELAALINEEIWSTAVAETFGPLHPATAQDLADMWTAFSHHDGQLLAAALLHYVADRAVDGAEWTKAMETAGVPTAFIWGPSDPVSGQHMIDEVLRRRPDANVSLLPGVGHWPMIEDPDAVTSSLSDFLR